VRLPDPERSRVVLIGSSRYEDKNLPDLPAVGRGTEDLKAVLTDSVHGLISENHCDVLEDEGDIRLIGSRLTRAASQAEDLLLVYFAGHGLTAGKRHELYLALRHTDWEAPLFNALEYDKLRSAVLNSPATTKMIILDCCFSGRAFGDTMADPTAELIGQVEVDGSYVLASAHRNQVALILPGEDHTAFTGRLLRLFHDGVPGGPELLTIDDIYQQLRRQMKAEGLPQPRKRGTDSANLLALARNRAYAASGAEAAQAGGPLILLPLPVSIRPSSQGVAQPGSVTEPIGIINDRYELYDRRTHGNVAYVYVARDLNLGRVVAVKLLHDAIATDNAYFERFNAAAKAAAALSDPGIGVIHDYGKAEFNGSTVAYIVMEYVQGAQTLREVLRERGRLAPSQAVAVVDNFLLTLDVIHRNDLLYQEMTLSNIVLTPAGGIKVFNAFNLGFTPTIISSETDRVTPIGIIEYTSPEEVRGAEVDVRSDIYCTGCLLYELLTGQRPFAGNFGAADIWRFLKEDPPAPSATSPEIPSWCDRIALKALARDPRLRYQTPIEMRKEIRAAIRLHRPYE